MPTTLYLETGSNDPAYNLAYEEYVQTHRRDGSYLILWQNSNSIIIGRNQNAEEEINRPFVDAHEIRVVRRNTGGGAVYHDLGNLNYSFITDAGASDQITAQQFTGPVVNALRLLGLDAECSGRNDILVFGKKVSGTAQHLHKGRILHHGTLLFASDPDMITGSLRPDPSKFQSKSVKSVRSRVGNIRDYLPADMDLPKFWQYLKTMLAGQGFREISLSPEELQEIEALKAAKYDTWQWNFGRSPKFQMCNKHRWPSGLLEVHLSVEGGIICQLQILGDFLARTPVDILENALQGCTMTENSLQNALTGIPLADCLGGITPEQLIKTILNKL